MLYTTKIVAKRRPKHDPQKEQLEELGIEIQDDEESSPELVKVQFEIEDIQRHFETYIELDDGEEVEAVMLDMVDGRQMVIADDFEVVASLRIESQEREEQKRQQYLEALARG